MFESVTVKEPPMWSIPPPWIDAKLPVIVESEIVVVPELLIPAPKTALFS